MTRWRRRLRRARWIATLTVASLVIAVAVLVGLVQLALPLAVHYPDFVARQLAERLHRPVKFTAIESQWRPSGPLLTVRNLTLGPGRAGGQSITLPHAALKFDFGAWLRPSHRWVTLRLKGMELRLTHSTSGWQVAGFANAGGSTHASLQSLPVDLDLRDLRVDIVDAAAHRSWRLFAPRLLAVNVGNVIRFGARIRQVGTTQTVAVNGQVDSARRDYVLHVATHGLDLAAATRGLDLHGYQVRSGRGGVELWGRWHRGKLAAVTARYDVDHFAMAGPDGRSSEPAVIAGAFRAVRVADGWDLALRGPGEARADIDQAGGAVVHVRGHAGAWRIAAAARALDAGPWLSLLAMAPSVPKAFAEWIAHARPGLHLDSAAAVWDQHGAFDATARFSALHALPANAVPGVELAHGVVRADNRALSIELPAQPATIALTHVFRKPFIFQKLGGTLVAWRDDGAWNVAVDGLRFAMHGLDGAAHAHLTWPGRGRRPHLSAYATVDRAKVPVAALFWPYRNMSPALVAWLDRAMVGGDVVDGRVLLRGDLDDWPFTNNKGRFEAAGTVRNTTFQFNPQWPRATGVDADVDFVDDRMDVVATHAVVQGVTVSHATATIPELHDGVLGLDVRGGGTGGALLGFVQHSPVGADAREALDGLKIGGKGNFTVDLSMPLNHAQAFTLTGKVDLSDADVSAAKWNLELGKLTGPLLIDGKGFHAQDLAATFHGAPARLSIAVGSNVADPGDIVEASLDTRSSAQALVKGYPDLDALVAHASGSAPFQVDVKVAAGHGNAPATPTLNVKSSLEGIALDFPAPLDKPAATRLPLDVSLPLPPAGAPLSVSLGDVLQVRGRLADPARDKPIALAMNFGGAPPPAIPSSGLVVGGHAQQLDVGGWIEESLGTSSGGSFPQLTRADVTADAATVFGTDLGALQFVFEAGPQADTISLAGPAVEGVIDVPTSDLMTRGITAHLKHVYWPEAPKPSHAGPPPPSAASPIAPYAIPPLHVSVGDLKLGNVQLGATVLESAPTLTGMHIERFESKGADFTIKARGNWNGTRAASYSHMLTDISSHDFSKTLAEFGFSGLLAGGENSHVRIDGSWPGAPSSFSLAWMTGTLDIKMGEGRILAVKPGLGRLLGLLSLRDLPSRLTLHFGDVFKSGFGFDHASAQFTFKDGSAYTRDMVIAAPAAEITMHGRAGFRARDFDLTVDVTPHVGGALPVVGAVVGGPVGAAAGLVVQGLVGKGLNKAARSAYRVTGSWDKPIIVAASATPAAAASTANASPRAPPAASRSGAGADAAPLAVPSGASAPLPAATVALPDAASSGT